MTPDLRLRGSALFLGNARALMLVQLISYVMPILLIPHLTRALGVELYGVVAIGLALVQAGNVLTDYGFNLSATYRIATNRDDIEHVERTFAAVTACKSILLLLTLTLITAGLLLQDRFAEHTGFLFAMCLSIVGQAYQPQWLLQGLERLRLVTLYTLVSRSIFFFLVLALVHRPQDIYVVSFANGIGHLTAAAIGMWSVRKLGYRLRWPDRADIAAAFKESSPFFWSRAAVMTYTSGATLVLGFMAGPVEVARYAVAEQLYRGGQALFAPVPQALYPNMAKDKNMKLFAWVFKGSLLVGTIGAFVGLLVGMPLLEQIFGIEYRNSYPVLAVFIVTLFVTMPSSLLGYPFLGAFGKLAIANRSLLFAGMFQLALLFSVYLAGIGSALTVACCVLIVELFVLAYRIKYAFPLYTHGIRAVVP